VQNNDNCITEYGCEPFDIDHPELQSLHSGVLASTATLTSDLEFAHQAGEELFQVFCT
jgi:hypothetical protein